MRPHIEELAQITSCYVSAYPNAGLPNTMGEYDESPEHTASIISEWAKEGWVNLVGGCCGTTPEHIAAIAKSMKKYEPRKLQPPTPNPPGPLKGEYFEVNPHCSLAG